MKENENKEEKQQNDEKIENNPNSLVDSYQKLNLKPELIEGINAFGFVRPSIIEQKAILPIIQGKNVTIQAESCLEKSAALAIGSLQLIDPAKNGIQCLVLCKERELTNKTFLLYQLLSDVLKVKVCLSFSGSAEEGTQLLVSMPGRLLFSLQNGKIDLSELQYLVLEEADEMLVKGYTESDDGAQLPIGFYSNIVNLVSLIPKTTKILLSTTNMTEGVVDFSTQCMKDSTNIIIKNEELTMNNIKQYYINLNSEKKMNKLIEIYDKFGKDQTTIISCNNQQTVDNICNEFEKGGIMISRIDGTKKMNERDLIMRDFRNGVIRLLVIINLNIFVRSIDSFKASLVINYDIPKEKEIYIRRIGRSRKFGMKGNVINFVSPDENDQFDEIQKYYNNTIETLPNNLSELE